MTGTRRLLVCRPGMEPALLRELAADHPRGTHRVVADGAVLSVLDAQDAEVEPCLAFSRQCIPDAVELVQPSINTWGAALAAHAMETLSGHEGPWRLDVFAQDIPGAAVKAGRCALVDDAAMEVLKKRQRRLVRSRVPSGEPFAADEAVVQLFLHAPDRGFAGTALPAARHHLRRVLSHAPGGIHDIPDDRAPPSRAFKKLREALWHAGLSIQRGQHVVDLGACPGGWTHVAVHAGAHVTAVDRSPLVPALMAHPRVTFVSGDAFAWKPARRVDWLVCDVIAFPARTLELLHDWLGERRCRHFCVTIKFRGDEHHAVLQDVKSLMRNVGAEFILRQLTHNKNECTVVGTLPS